MPYIGKPKGYDEYIGHGTEKKVYGSAVENLDTKVIKESHSNNKNERDHNYIKAQYYLSKILNLLLPKNVPDIHFATVENGKHITVEQRINQDINLKKNIDPINFLKERKKLAAKFYDLGLFYDDGANNFSFDDQGNIVYLDSVNPWRKFVKDDERVLEINEGAFKKAIGEIADVRSREEANNYLERLKILYQKEMEDRKSRLINNA